MADGVDEQDTGASEPTTLQAVEAFLDAAQADGDGEPEETEDVQQISDTASEQHEAASTTESGDEETPSDEGVADDPESGDEEVAEVETEEPDEDGLSDDLRVRAEEAGLDPDDYEPEVLLKTLTGIDRMLLASGGGQEQATEQVKQPEPRAEATPEPQAAAPEPPTATEFEPIVLDIDEDEFADPEAHKAVASLVEKFNARLKAMAEKQDEALARYEPVLSGLEVEQRTAAQRKSDETLAEFDATVKEIGNVDLFGDADTLNLDKKGSAYQNRAKLVSTAGALSDAVERRTGKPLPVKDAIRRAFAAEFTEEATKAAVAKGVEQKEKARQKHRSRQIGRPSGHVKEQQTAVEEAIEAVREIKEGKKT